MLTKRIIPCLDVRNGRVVKGKKFKDIVDVDDPATLGKFYSDCGADELVFYDITASNEDGSDEQYISSVFIPLKLASLASFFISVDLPVPGPPLIM